MKSGTPENSSVLDRVEAFVGAGLEGEMTESQLKEFERLLLESEEARDIETVRFNWQWRHFSKIIDLPAFGCFVQTS